MPSAPAAAAPAPAATAPLDATRWAGLAGCRVGRLAAVRRIRSSDELRRFLVDFLIALVLLVEDRLLWRRAGGSREGQAQRIEFVAQLGERQRARFALFGTQRHALAEQVVGDHSFLALRRPDRLAFFWK